MAAAYLCGAKRAVVAAASCSDAKRARGSDVVPLVDLPPPPPPPPVAAGGGSSSATVETAADTIVGASTMAHVLDTGSDAHDVDAADAEVGALTRRENAVPPPPPLPLPPRYLLPAALKVPRDARRDARRLPRGYIMTGACIGVGTYGAVYLANEVADGQGAARGGCGAPTDARHDAGHDAGHGATDGGGADGGVTDGGGAACKATVRAAGVIKVFTVVSRNEEAAQSESVTTTLTELMGRDGMLGGNAADAIAPVTTVLRGPDWRQWYMVMPLAPLTLDATVFRRTPLPLAAVRVLARQLITALVTLHRRGVAHCDLKPSNVLVTATADAAPRLYLTDMGMASRRARCDDPNVTTINWRAPEVARGLPYDPRAADMWAVGVMLRELLCGTPFIRDLESNDQNVYALKYMMHRRGVPAADEWPELYDGEDGAAAAARDAAAEVRTLWGLPPHSGVFVRAADRARWRFALLGSADGVVPHDDAAEDFLERLLAMNPARRPTAEEAATHAFLAGDANDWRGDAQAVALFTAVGAAARYGPPALNWVTCARSMGAPFASAASSLENALLTDVFLPLTLADRYADAAAPPLVLAASPLPLRVADLPPLPLTRAASADDGDANASRADCVLVMAGVCATRLGYGALTFFTAANMLHRALAAAAVPLEDVPLLAVAALFVAQACTVEVPHQVSLAVLARMVAATLGRPFATSPSTSPLLRCSPRAPPTPSPSPSPPPPPSLHVRSYSEDDGATLATLRQLVAELAPTLHFSVYGGSGALHEVSLFHALRAALPTLPDAVARADAVYLVLVQLCFRDSYDAAPAAMTACAVAHDAWDATSPLGRHVAAKLQGDPSAVVRREAWLWYPTAEHGTMEARTALVGRARARATTAHQLATDFVADIQSRV